MKKLVMGIASLLMLLAATASAGTRVAPKDARTIELEKYHSMLKTPAPQIFANQDVKIEVVSNKIFRSCCKPPDLSMVGRVTNTSGHPIDYVRLVLAFKDYKGKVTHTEDAYNQKAVTMGEDADVAAMLGDKPHFEPLAPGATDTFQFMMPLPLAGPFTSVDLLAADVARDSTVAAAH